MTIRLQPGRRRHRGHHRGGRDRRPRAPRPQAAARRRPEVAQRRDAAPAGLRRRATHPRVSGATRRRRRTTPSSSAPAPTGWSRPTGSPRRAGACCCSRRSPRSAARSAATAGVDPAFVHDTFSAFYPLALASPVIRSLELEQHGLEWSHAPAPLGHPLPGGDWAMIHPDRHDTAAGLDALHTGDGEAWLQAVRRLGPRRRPASSRPSWRPGRRCAAGVGALASMRHVGGLAFVKELLTPVVGLGRARFGGEAPRLLLAGNGGHSDIPLDAPGSGIFGMLLTMLAQTVGFPVPRGGAGELTAGHGAPVHLPRRRDPRRLPRRARRGRPGPGPGRAHRRRRALRRTPCRGRRRVRAGALRAAGGARGPAGLGGEGDDALRARPGHRQGRLGPGRAGAVDLGAAGGRRAACTWPTRSRRCRSR